MMASSMGYNHQTNGDLSSCSFWGSPNDPTRNPVMVSDWFNLASKPCRFPIDHNLQVYEACCLTILPHKLTGISQHIVILCMRFVRLAASNENMYLHYYIMPKNSWCVWLPPAIAARKKVVSKPMTSGGTSILGNMLVPAVNEDIKEDILCGGKSRGLPSVRCCS